VKQALTIRLAPWAPSTARLWPVAAALAIVVHGASAPAGENWSRFRGPNGSGVASEVNFPATWTADDYAWKIELPGGGHSSPVGWEGQLFVTSCQPDRGEISLSAVNAATGEIAWTRSFKAGAGHLHAANSYASSTPATDAQRVYVSWAGPDLLMVAALTHEGEKVWQRELGPIDYKHGPGGSLALVDDLVVVANDDASHSYIAALNTETGEPRWRRERSSGTESYATPAVWQTPSGAKQIIVNSTQEGMAGLSPADGSIEWQLKDVFPVRCVGSPLVAGQLVFGTSGEGGNGKSCTAVRPPMSSGDKPSVAYQLIKSLPQVPTPVATDELLFIWSDRGVVSCYDLATGKPHWTERVGGNYYSSPIIAGDKLYSVAADGQVVAIAADKEFKLLGRTELGNGSSATPTVHGGRLVLRAESSLASLPANEKK
jgi:outer membrane protein assembly factor BamB